MPVASGPSHEIRNLPLLDAAGEALVIMNMPGTNHIRNTSRSCECRIEDVPNVLAPTMMVVERICRVVYRHQEGLVWWGVAEFIREPVTLILFDLTTLRDIAVEPDDRDKRGFQREITIGLNHRFTVHIAGVRGYCCRRGAEIPHERAKGRFAKAPRVAIMVSRNRDDGDVIVLVGRIELRVVVFGQAVVVDDVTE